MGANNSKDKLKSKSSELLDEKKLQIGLLLDIDNLNKKEVTRDKVKSIWNKYLSTDLLTAMVNVIFNDKRTYITFDEFFKFYCKNCEDNNFEDEAETLLNLSVEISGASLDCLKLEYLSSVVSEFLKSYIKIINLEQDSNLKTLTKFSKIDESTKVFSAYLTDDLCTKEINKEEVNRWISRSSFFHIIMQNTYKNIFNTLNTESKIQLIPKMIYKSNYETCLSICDILLLRCHITSTNKWRLLYNMEYDGQSWATFLKAILAQGPTIIIIYDTNGYSFGAYASQSWNINPNFYGDEHSFLFSLRPNMNIFEPSGYNSNYQYINTGQSTLPNGLGMGGLHSYWGLFIDSDFGSGLVSESCTTFKKYRKLSLDKEFKIDKLEVWGTGEPDPTPEELGERVTSCLDKDPAAAAILELAGRQLHSTEIRKMKHIDEE